MSTLVGGYAQLPRSFGVGLDLPWGGSQGWSLDDVHRPTVATAVSAFFERHGGDFDHAFFSFQARDRSLLDPAHYIGAWRDLCAMPGVPSRVGLHHTMLNLGTVDVLDEQARADRACRFAFTNALCAAVGLQWINEDLGIWSVDHKRLPYPLPPLLTEQGLGRAIEEVRAAMAGLEAPLFVEFPGFSEEVSLVIGPLHAYDHFRALIKATGAAVTLDTGHLLSYQWFLGKRGEALYDDLDRLPLEHCVEIHLSGCEIRGDRFLDLHHGILLEEQIELLRRLMARCPALRLVTYEDPALTPEGELVPESQASFEALREVVDGWR